MSQSINLSTTATTVTKFNGTDVTKINLNGTEIWAKPSSGPASWHPSALALSAPNPKVWISYTNTSGVLRYGQVDRTNGKLYSQYSTSGVVVSGSHSLQYSWWNCQYACSWSSYCCQMVVYREVPKSEVSGTTLSYSGQTMATYY